MVHLRRDVWSFDDTWNDTITWYEKAVTHMSTLGPGDPLGWRYHAAIHGIDVDLWTQFGYLQAGQVLPDLFDTVWNQCQHQSWYFLPWHRAYLASFEAVVRATIVQLGGSENWTMPYWNYNGARYPRAIELPLAFRTPTKPDGTPNALYVERRYGTNGLGAVVINPQRIRLDALKQADFFNDLSGGFGGPQTGFANSGDVNGQLESRPHNGIHTMVGGVQPGGSTALEAGLMSMPDTAALDPIFWLHHCNIDRLWEVWLRRDSSNVNPDESAWEQGPLPPARGFIFPRPDGTLAPAQPQDQTDTQKLGYAYDDLTDPFPELPPRPKAKPKGSLLEAILPGFLLPKSLKPTAVFASNQGRIQLGSTEGETRVKIDAAAKPKPTASLESLSAAPRRETRVYLSLESIQTRNEAAIFDVYVAPPASPGAPAGQEVFVGSVSMFGARKASDPGGAHAGGGINEALDITDTYLSMQQAGAFDGDEVTVRFRSATEVADLQDVSVGKVSLIRQNR